MFFFLVLSMACNDAPHKPNSPDDCQDLNKGELRDDCWSEHAVTVFKDDEARGISIVETQISDPRIADYIWLTVTREHNPSTRTFCDRIKDRALKERCLVLVSRPHLHRDVLKSKAASVSKN